MDRIEECENLFNELVTKKVESKFYSLLKCDDMKSKGISVNVTTCYSLVDEICHVQNLMQ